MSASRFAILGMLTLEPMTGYDMKKLTSEAFVHFWHESYGNLYPRLRQLASEGLVTVRSERRSSGPDAKVYSLTRRGREAFLAWLEERSTPEPVRSELLLRVFFGAQAPPVVTERHLLDYREQQKQTQAVFAAIESRLRTEAGGKPDQMYWLMVLRRGQLTAEARLRWCEESLALLRTLEPAEPSS